MALNDQFILQTDPTFIQRVRAAIIATAIAISTEGFNVVYHKQRADKAADIIGNPEGFKLLYAASVATDATVISDATQANTVSLTTGNVAAQAALVTDVHINSAISSQWNSFLKVP